MPPPYCPAPNPDAVVTVGNARFTVLTPRLIRIEWSPTAQFEDRASFAFVNRRTVAPKFETRRTPTRLVIRTAALTLRYAGQRERINSRNLSIEFRRGGKPVQWSPSSRNRRNLRGTRRTLDGVSDPTRLDPGLLSRDGWTLIDDSGSFLFDDGDWPWVTPREQKDAIDWYFFCYDRDYGQALKDFTLVAGRIPLPPIHVFGAWWSRFWDYTEHELRELVAEFRAHGVPLDVLVLDMGWHLEGWTGYTWNPQCFPDPEGFFRWAHREGLRVPLNLHPHHGVGKHEAAFDEMTRALGRDPETTDRIPFDCADRRFVEAYFKYLHHPLERQGVDFWWLDWQQNGGSSIPGLDPLFWLNYLHWTDQERNPGNKDERPLIFSRWGGLGNHRYPIGFSGDTFSHWPVLAFQPYFTATAGNVGYAYWSHDIGGHQPGPIEPELYARWIQFGAFSPVLRPHAAMHAEAERRPWAFDQTVHEAARKAWLLRYELLPYVYTMARKAYDESLPLCRPLYHHWPELEEAYQRPGQYLFGDELLVAPVTTPANTHNRCAAVTVWLPPGQWTCWFSGRTYDGPCEIRLSVPLDHIPLFVRTGAVIPTAPPMKHTREKPLDPLILHVFPGTDAQTRSFRLYEDDGHSLGYQRGECRWTPIACETTDAHCRVEVGPAAGSFPGALRERGVELRIHDVLPATRVAINGQPFPPGKPSDTVGWWYDAETFSIVARLPKRDVTRKMRAAVRLFREPALSALLRSGLRGQTQVLRQVASRLRDRPVPQLRKYLSVGRRLARSPGRAAALARSLEGATARLVSLVQASQLEEPFKTEALTRVLGLFTKTAIRRDDQVPDRLSASVEAAVAPPLQWSDELDFEVRLERPGNWAAAGEPRVSAVGTGDNRAVVLGLPLERTGVVQTTVIRATIDVSIDGTKLTIPTEEVLFPSINAWWVAGPFEKRDMPRLDARFSKLKRVDAARTFAGKDGKTVGWKRVERKLTRGADQTTEFFVNFTDVFGEKVYDTVAYALTFLRAPAPTAAALRLGSDDGVIAWLNGAEVHRHIVGRAYISKVDTALVRLNQGDNILVLRIDQGGGDWGFAVHLETPGGQPLPRVEVR